MRPTVADEVWRVDFAPLVSLPAPRNAEDLGQQHPRHLRVVVQHVAPQQEIGTASAWGVGPSVKTAWQGQETNLDVICSKRVTATRKPKIALWRATRRLSLQQTLGAAPLNSSQSVRLGVHQDAQQLVGAITLLLSRRLMPHVSASSNSQWPWGPCKAREQACVTRECVGVGGGVGAGLGEGEGEGVGGCGCTWTWAWAWAAWAACACGALELALAPAQARLRVQACLRLRMHVMRECVCV